MVITRSNTSKRDTQTTHGMKSYHYPQCEIFRPPHRSLNYYPFLPGRIFRSRRQNTMCGPPFGLFSCPYLMNQSIISRPPPGIFFSSSISNPITTDLTSQCKEVLCDDTHSECSSDTSVSLDVKNAVPRIVDVVFDDSPTLPFTEIMTEFLEKLDALIMPSVNKNDPLLDENVPEFCGRCGNEGVKIVKRNFYYRNKLSSNCCINCWDQYMSEIL